MISGVRSIWRRATAPTLSGEIARRREAVLLGVLAGLIGLSLAAHVIQLAEMVADATAAALGFWLVNVAVLTAFVVLHRAARRGRRRMASTVVVVLLAGLAVLLLLGGGIERPMWPLVLGLAVLLAGVLLGGRPAFVTVAGAACAVLPVAALQQTGAFTPLLLEGWETTTDVGGAIGLLAVLGFFALVCVLYTREGVASIGETLSHGADASPMRQLRTRELTLREVEVVQLVAEGKSNDAIAAHLFVSARTVQSHVANAMRKAGCANRTELGVLAVREGLAPLEPLHGEQAPPFSRTAD